jgi:hypothetical protein
MSKAKIRKLTESSGSAVVSKKSQNKSISKPSADAHKSSPKSKPGRLVRLNKWLAIGYGVQAIALLLFSVGRTFPITIHFLGKDTLASQAAGHTVYASASQHLLDVSLPQILGLSLAISAVFHLIVARWLKAQYTDWLAEGSNPLRWLDGAFSVSLLPVAIGLVAGLSDITSILMLFVLGFATHLLGLYMEAYNQKRANHLLTGKKPTGPGPTTDYRPFLLLCITGASACIVLGASVLAAVVFGAGLPPGIWLAYVLGVISVIAYLVVMMRTYRRTGRFADYRYSELASITLSFVAKSGIAWLLFSAVLAP